MNILDWWKSHGTKIIGAVGSLIALLEMLDVHTVSALVSGPKAGWIALGVGSLLTFLRGFQNTLTQIAQQTGVQTTPSSTPPSTTGKTP